MTIPKKMLRYAQHDIERQHDVGALVPEDLFEGKVLYRAEGGDEGGVEIIFTTQEPVVIFPVLDPFLLEGFDILQSHVLDSIKNGFITALGKAEIPE